eukprot:TRINITY_DN30455_c0_g1_i1.p1 TRINITY_DN30455_c0_g1~~TRINITY_DN30455_c0_g1_i1.p1  ORF type:complete len:397 (-),score=7.35 TRINITY_DN30455_c0_g1_i1:220-1410(-)
MQNCISKLEFAPSWQKLINFKRFQAITQYITNWNRAVENTLKLEVEDNKLSSLSCQEQIDSSVQTYFFKQGSSLLSQFKENMIKLFVLKRAVKCIQKCYRKWIEKVHHLKQERKQQMFAVHRELIARVNAATLIQSQIRSYQARKFVKYLKQQQNYIRRTQVAYNCKVYYSAIKIQKAFKWYVTRRRMCNTFISQKRLKWLTIHAIQQSIIIQKYFRGYLVRKKILWWKIKLKEMYDERYSKKLLIQHEIKIRMQQQMEKKILRLQRIREREIAMCLAQIQKEKQNMLQYWKQWVKQQYKIVTSIAMPSNWIRTYNYSNKLKNVEYINSRTKQVSHIHPNWLVLESDVEKKWWELSGQLQKRVDVLYGYMSCVEQQINEDMIQILQDNKANENQCL